MGQQGMSEHSRPWPVIGFAQAESLVLQSSRSSSTPILVATCLIVSWTWLGPKGAKITLWTFKRDWMQGGERDDWSRPAPLFFVFCFCPLACQLIRRLQFECNSQLSAR